MLSFWEKESFLRYDFIVVGGGMIGLSTAFSLREKFPTASVLVLERGVLPSGASTKNVGFLSVGTFTEVLSDTESLGLHTTLEIIAKRKQGIALIRERLGDAAIGFEPYGGYELILEKDVALLSRLAEVNRWLGEIFPGEVFEPRPDLQEKFGFPATQVKALIHNPFDAQARTGQLMQALWTEVCRRNIKVVTGAEVQDVVDTGAGVALKVNGSIEFQARYAAICTNARVSALVPETQVKPARGQVLITAPIENLPFRGTFNFDQGYYYFRDVGKRLIVGGARHTDRGTETTLELALNEGIQRRLEEALSTILLPGQSPAIEQRWAGTMGFSANRLPIVRRVSPHLAVGFGCNSMGIALGSVIGQETAALF